MLCTAHFHLLVNHFPILGIFFGLILAILALILQNRTLRFTALGFLLFSSLTFLPSNATGEQAEEQIEHLDGVSHTLIHEHEEKAESALPFAIIVGVLAIIGIILEAKKHKLPQALLLVNILMALWLMYLLAQVATSGGEIRHPEIRKDFKPIMKKNG